MAETSQLEEFISGKVTIPTIPRTLMEINRIVNDPDGSAAEAAEIVAQDPAIASKVLRLANSSLYALKVAVSDIQHAVSILGLKILKNLVVQATVLEQFNKKEESADSGICANWLWDHSLKTARAARSIVHLTSMDFGLDREEAYTAGLLHDIGKILMLDELPRRYRRAVSMSRSAGIPLYAAEERVFGFSHAAVGAVLAERWNMSALLRSAIENHHDEEPEEALPAAQLLGIANAVAHQVAEEPGGYYSGSMLSEEELNLFGLSPAKFEVVLDETQQTSLEEVT